MLKLKVPKTLNVKKLRDEKLVAIVLSVVAVIYVVMVTGTNNVRSKVVSFYNSKLGLGFAVISSLLAVILPRILKKQSPKTLILAGAVTIVNLFSVAYSASAKEDFLVPTGGTLKFTDEESGNKVSKKFEFTNSDDIDFGGLGSDYDDDDYDDDEDDDDDDDDDDYDGGGGDGGGGGTTGAGNDDSGDRGYGGKYDNMSIDELKRNLSKRELKKEKNRLKTENETKNKDRIKAISGLVSDIRDGGSDDSGGGGGTSTGAGNDDSGDRGYGGKYDNMSIDELKRNLSKRELKKEKNRLKTENETKNKDRIKAISGLVSDIRDGGSDDSGGGGGTSTGAGNDEDDDDSDYKCEGKSNKQIGKIIKKLKIKRESATGKDRKEIKKKIKTCRGLKNKEDFMNFFKKPEEKKEERMEKIEEIKCEKKVITPSVSNISGPDLGDDLYSLVDFEKKIIV